jgi:hypothetical protein
MHDESLYSYWQSGLQQQMLHSITQQQITQHGYRISRAEFETGKLQQSVIIDRLTLKGNLVAVLPDHASYILLVELQYDGNFAVVPHLSLPIFPRLHSELDLEALENLFVIEPPQWFETAKALSWEQQRNYACKLLDSIDTTRNSEDLDHALVLSVAELCPSVVMDLSLLNQPNKLHIIEAKRNSGKSAYARKLVIDAWIDAAVRCIAPPKFVWHEYGQALQYATIFSGSSANEAQQISGDAHSELMRLYNIYTQGNQTVKNWRDISNRIKVKYADKGDIYARLNQLHSNLKDAKVQLRHLQVLHSIWSRRLELLTKWSKFFDFIPWLQARRLQRLHLFFKQNFPEQNTTNFTQVQFEQLFEEKLRRVENSERFVADALHQAENDLQQENLIRDKCLNWCLNQNIITNNIDDIQKIVDDTLWQQVAVAAVNYWQEYFAMRPDELETFKNPPSAIDQLIVEHAEYISPMQAAQWLAISKRVIVMGSFAPLCVPRFSVNIDYELTKHYGLATCDADFEDLQFDGKLASLGNMWNLVTQGNEADEVLKPIVTGSLIYSYIDSSDSSDVLITLQWLRENQSLCQKLAIYSCFSDHVSKLHTALQNTPFADIPIRLVQQPCFDKKAISLFLPVYRSGDPGPYVFDRGNEIIDNLLANTTQQLIVIGDISIFKPELHSASGQLAKHLLLQEKEVTCV